MAGSIFGVPYAGIVQAYLANAAVSIDAGSFADDGSSPPLLFTATVGGNPITGSYDSITTVVAT